MVRDVIAGQVARAALPMKLGLVLPNRSFAHLLTVE